MAFIHKADGNIVDMFGYNQLEQPRPNKEDSIAATGKRKLTASIVEERMRKRKEIQKELEEAANTIKVGSTTVAYSPLQSLTPPYTITYAIHCAAGR